MAEETTTADGDNDELVCPITMEVFRDPVLAGDGRVYEREAISRWIFEHGTSPFTREPLQLDQLKPDDRLRQLAAKRRNSTVSYHAQTGTVVLPPLRNNRRIYPETHLMAPNYQYVPPGRSACRKCNKVTVGAIAVGVFIALSVVIGIIIAVTTSSSTNSYTSSPTVETLNSGQLSSNSSQFARPGYSVTLSSQYYYQAIRMVVSTSGNYQITSQSRIDLFGIVYTGQFNPTFPYSNFLVSDDDGGTGLQFYISRYLSSTNYVIVVTTYSSLVTGSYSISVRGPATVTLQ